MTTRTIIYENDVYTYTGNKVTYTETVVIPGAGGNYNYTGEKIQYSTTHTGFPSSYTKLVDIFGSEVIGKQIIYKDYSSSNCMNHHGSDHPTTVTIDANTTIDSLNLHSNAFIYFNYDPTNGEFIFTKTKFSDGCEGQVSGSFLSYLKSKYSSDVTSTTLGTIGGITQSQEKEVISLPDSMNTTTTTNHDMTTSTTMKDLFGDSNSHTLTVKVEGGTAKNLTFSSTDTVQTVINKLAAEGITASVTADHRFRVEADNRWTLSGEMAPKLFGGSGNQVYTCTGNKITYDETTTTPGTADPDGFIDAPDIHNPPSGGGTTITKTEYYYQGSKVTYTETDSSYASSSTKLVDLFGSDVIGQVLTVQHYNGGGHDSGVQIGPPSTGSGSSGGTTTPVAPTHMGAESGSKTITIDANTTLADLNAAIGFASFSYNASNGKFTLRTQSFTDGCKGTVSGTFVTYLNNKLGRSTPNISTDAFGGTTTTQTWQTAIANSSSETFDATLSTTLAQLFGVPSGSMLNPIYSFEVINNGKTTTLSFSKTDTIQDVIDELKTLGVLASFTDGALRVSSYSSDFQITNGSGGAVTIGSILADKLFGGSIPTVQTKTTEFNLGDYTASVSFITESTTLGELGITSGTLSNNGISLVGGSVPERTFTSDNTLGDVFSYLEAGGATVTLNTDGTVSITGNAELSGDLFQIFWQL